MKLDGEVGIIGNGAGLVMSTLDVVAGCGARPANFLDIGGGASAQVMADGLVRHPVRPGREAVFVNVFGGITACDAVADGIVQALETVPLDQAARRPPRRQQRRPRPRHPRRPRPPLVQQATTMDDAARRAAQLANATEGDGTWPSSSPRRARSSSRA